MALVVVLNFCATLLQPLISRVFDVKIHVAWKIGAIEKYFILSRMMFLVLPV